MPSARSNFTSKQANLFRDTSAYVFWAARRLVLQILACLFALKFGEKFERNLLLSCLLNLNVNFARIKKLC